MATSYTPNYNLDLYESTDKPNLRDQYNSAMGKIDAQMKKSADDVVNANANVLTLQTQMAEAQKTISDVKTTADTALSQSDTNKADIAVTNSNVDSLTTRLTTVEGVSDKNKSDIAAVSAGLEAAQADISTAQEDISTAQAGIETLTTSLAGKAPTNHASSSAVYGQAAPDTFGHVKVTDAIGDASATTGTASSPKGVQDAIKDWLKPDIVKLPAPASGSYATGMSVCMVYRKLKNLKFVFSLQLPGSGNDEYVKVCNCSDLGIPNPSEERTINSAVNYYAGSKGLTYLSTLKVRTNGDIVVEGWNNVSGGERVDWTRATAIQVLIDYSFW